MGSGHQIRHVVPVECVNRPAELVGEDGHGVGDGGDGGAGEVAEAGGERVGGLARVADLEAADDLGGVRGRGEAE